MSLNNITLSPQLLVELYESALVETSNLPIAQEPSFSFLGENKQQILIVSHSNEVEFLIENELLFLKNILGACKLSLADVAIVNKEKLPVKTYSDLIENFQSKTVLLFGVDPLTFGLPVNFPYFQLQQFNNCMYLYAPALSEIEQDKALKAKLWTALKNLLCL